MRDSGTWRISCIRRKLNQYRQFAEGEVLQTRAKITEDAKQDHGFSIYLSCSHRSCVINNIKC